MLGVNVLPQLTKDNKTSARNIKENVLFIFPNQKEIPIEQLLRTVGLCCILFDENTIIYICDFQENHDLMSVFV